MHHYILRRNTIIITQTKEKHPRTRTQDPSRDRQIGTGAKQLDKGRGRRHAAREESGKIVALEGVQCARTV